MTKISTSSKFDKALYRLNPKEILLFYKKEKLFISDPFQPGLKTHRLSGKLKSFWAFSINHHLRVIFFFENKIKVSFLDVGTHEIYK